MPVRKLRNSDVKAFEVKDKRYSIRDSDIPGLILRIEPTGKKTYYLDYRLGEKRSLYKIGDAAILTVAQAREVAREKNASIIKGLPLTEKKKTEELTAGDVFERYKPYVKANHKTTNAISFIDRCFRNFLAKPCSAITLREVEDWRDRQRGSLKASSINRAVTAFRAMLRWAKERDIINACPLLEKRIRSLPESDSRTVIRYLSADERKRLMAALNEREKKRGRDYLLPAVIISLNTGIRRGALFSLKWQDIDFITRTITLRAETAKNSKTNAIPMNEIVYRALVDWKENGEKAEMLFSYKGQKMHDVRSSWAKILREAAIENFRWHDMRHDFASQLVMADVNILTVKELMTHSSLEMTLRYAHLAPKKKHDAVAQLNTLYSPE